MLTLALALVLSQGPVTLWVDQQRGADRRSGATRAQALRTVEEAWRRIPAHKPLTKGYRIMLTRGTYPAGAVPNYWESRWGSARAPISIESADGPGAAVLPALNLFDVRYLSLVGLRVRAGGGDVLHCERCDHFTVSKVQVAGGAEVQEAVKVNQSSYVTIEDSDISGAGDNSIDFVAVQHGDIRRNRIHGAGDWCMYVKGGSAYHRVEGNEIFDCGTGGFTAGQGTGFEFMVSPWLHYEAYDVVFVNNVVHDTEGAGMGVNGGYDVLLAYNTLYRVGAASHVLEAVFGLRGCDGNVTRCRAYLGQGGWGTAATGHEEPIGNRHVFFLNNVVYNPRG